ncbi:hypothetical protein AVEN_205409-1 [Araneus ventricosus]|uniref:Uncharacterized protein n=1 Tax=Araneus ventricosus TaxID=182803 RepID=A0A4Y2LYU1_ARAVE|nr:hypothetical protein AVEN_205409-1 [Araneus ventricosus]
MEERFKFDEDEAVNTIYRDLIGRLMYISLGSRLDITISVSYLSQYLKIPEYKGSQLVFAKIKSTVLKLSGCEKLTDDCVEEWLYGDQEEEITDDAIIHMITEEEVIDETEDLNDETDKIISLAEGTAALDVALRYIEQNQMLYHITFYL